MSPTELRPARKRRQQVAIALPHLSSECQSTHAQALVGLKVLAEIRKVHASLASNLISQIQDVGGPLTIRATEPRACTTEVADQPIEPKRRPAQGDLRLTILDVATASPLPERQQTA
jgi:hypothetical protein